MEKSEMSGNYSHEDNGKIRNIRKVEVMKTMEKSEMSAKKKS